MFQRKLATIIGITILNVNIATNAFSDGLGNFYSNELLHSLDNALPGYDPYYNFCLWNCTETGWVLEVNTCDLVNTTCYAPTTACIHDDPYQALETKTKCEF